MNFGIDAYYNRSQLPQQFKLLSKLSKLSESLIGNMQFFGKLSPKLVFILAKLWGININPTATTAASQDSKQIQKISQSRKLLNGTLLVTAENT